MLHFLKSVSKIYYGVVMDLKNCYIIFRDGTATPVELTVKVGEGNFTYSEKLEREYILDRGTLDSVRNGDEQPMDVSMDFTWDYIAGTGTTGNGTVEDFLKRANGFSANTSTDTATCSTYAIDIRIIHIPECDPGEASLYCEVIDLSDFRYEELSHDVSAGSISCTGRCNTTSATPTRVAYSSALSMAGL